MNNSKRNKSEKEDLTRYDKSIKKFKNSKIFVAFLIILSIYGGVTEIIKKTYENKENLFGENGLLKKNDTVNSSQILESDTTQKLKIQLPVIGYTRMDKGFYKHPIHRIIKRDTIILMSRDTVYISDTSSPKPPNQKYSFRSDEIKEGKAFVDPLTNSTISIFRIQPDFTASAILDYPDGFNTIYFQKPDPIKVRPGDSWNNIYYHEKSYKLTIVNINNTDKTFSIEIQENN